MTMTVLQGPLNRRRSSFGILGAIGLVVILTLLTEFGGIVLWLAYGIGEVLGRRRGSGYGVATLFAFVVGYGVLTIIVVPAVAPYFGRVALNCFADKEYPYEANAVLYCALNRHFVRPQTKIVLEDLSKHMAGKYPGTIVSYLDAGFPFVEGLPLLPHRSHNDGKKLDLAFFYQEKGSGKRRDKAGAWPVGYWAFDPAWLLRRDPPSHDHDGPLRWRMGWLQPIFSNLELDRERTTEMLQFLSTGKTSRPIRRLFVEPYLADALNVQSDKIGFAGWNAARHDDHLHFELF